MLALDLLVFNKKAHEVSLKEATGWSIVWIALALLFNLYIFVDHGADVGLNFLTAYLVEKSLSIDNLFVFLAIFAFFRIDAKHQHRVLFWGIIAALIMRMVFIMAGAMLLQQFEWMMYVFGVFLIYTGAKLAFGNNEEYDPSKSWIMRLSTRYLRTTKELRGSSFFVREGGLLYATPLFLVLIVINVVDLMFAFDSVPAVLAITPDLFVVYTSNIFAILGLRALYFLVSGALGRLRFLDIGLAIILAYIGVKMLLMQWVHIPVGLSLGIIAAVLALTITLSLLFKQKKHHDTP
jgi:tellurite resistance protein TerC